MNIKKSDTIGTARHKGNTNKLCRKKVRQRARSWCFTYNGYSKKDVTQLALDFDKIGVIKYIYQEELGENNNEHLQGVVSFKNATELSSLKKINSKIHWEQCISLRASIKYCSKEETRNGEIKYDGIQSTELWHKPIPKLTKEEYYEWWKKKLIEEGDKELRESIREDEYIRLGIMKPKES